MIRPDRPQNFEELVDRLVELEERKLKVQDLPLSALESQLFEHGTPLPDADTFLLPHSVGADSLELPSVRGIINSDGSTAEGTGFTSVRNAVGNYTITFNPTFADVPAVTGNAEGASVVVRIEAVAIGSVNIFLPSIVTGPGNLTDAKFHFHAIGPR